MLLELISPVSFFSVTIRNILILYMVHVTEFYLSIGQSQARLFN